MKIFSWISQILHSNPDYSRVSHKKDDALGHGAEGEQCRDEHNTEAPLLQRDHYITAVHHVLDGILAIGTLGHDSLNLQPYCCDPLPPFKAEAEEDYAVVERKPLAVEFLMQEKPLPKQDMEVEDLLLPLLKEEEKEKVYKKRERTTLAHLFLVSESSIDEKANPSAVHHPQLKAEKPGAATTAVPPDRSGRHRRSLASGLKIAKMFKKKIHPETEGKLENTVLNTLY